LGGDVVLLVVVGVVVEEPVGAVVDEVVPVPEGVLAPVPDEDPCELPDPPEPPDDDVLGELLEGSPVVLLERSFDEESPFASCSCCASHSANFGWFFRNVSFCSGVIWRHLARHSPLPGPEVGVADSAQAATEPMVKRPAKSVISFIFFIF
jgi:hypothetical protein